MLTLIDCGYGPGAHPPWITDSQAKCQAKLRVRDDTVGKSMRCPRCGWIYKAEDVATLVLEDSVIREYLKTRLACADLDAPGSIRWISIVRNFEKVIVHIHSSREGVFRDADEDDDDVVTDRLTDELQELTRRHIFVLFSAIDDTKPQLAKFKRKLSDAEDERRLELEVVEDTDSEGKASASETAPSRQLTPPRAAAAAPSIFISYRREDSIDATGRLADRLVARFGRERVFIDVDSMPLGVDFRQHLSTAVGRCRVLLAVIADRWLDCSHDSGPHKGRRRLDDPADFVRIEIEAALQRDIPVIPVLVGSARVPAPEALPPSLEALSYRHGAEVRPGRDFNGHVEHLLRSLEQLLGD
jgi:hypothetical protein